MTTYNGWTNYETWRINLEVLDGMTLEDFGFDEVPDVDELATAIQVYTEDAVLEEAKGLARDLVFRFLKQVDWEEIAEHMIHDYSEEA